MREKLNHADCLLNTTWWSPIFRGPSQLPLLRLHLLRPSFPVHAHSHLTKTFSYFWPLRFPLLFSPNYKQGCTWTSSFLCSLSLDPLPGFALISSPLFKGLSVGTILSPLHSQPLLPFPLSPFHLHVLTDSTSPLFLIVVRLLLPLSDWISLR